MIDDATPGRWRLAGIGAAVAGFLLVAAAIHVSTYDVEYGTRIWFAHVIEADAPAALRIGVLERPGGKPIRSAKALVSLVAESDADDAVPSESAGGSTRRVDLGELESGDTGFIEEVVQLPADFLPGPYVLMVFIRPLSGPSELAVQRVEVLAAGAKSRGEWVSVRPACEESSGRSPEGGWHASRRCTREPGRLHLYPDAGSLVAHVSRPIHVWLRPEHRPGDPSPDQERDAIESPEADRSPEDLSALPGMVEIVDLRPAVPGQREHEPAGPAIHLAVDALGLATFEYEPSFPRGSFLLQSGDEVERIWLRDLPAQLGVVPGKRLLAQGEMLDVEIWLRQPNRSVFLDLLVDGAWIGAYSGMVRGESERLGIPLPAGTSGLVLLRASLSPDGAGATVTGAWIDSEPERKAVANLARSLASLPEAAPLATYRTGTRRRDALIDWVAALDDAALAEITPRDAHRAGSAMLSRLESSLSSAPLLTDTTGHKLLALDAWKERVRRPILGGLLVIGLLALGCGGWLAVSYQRLVRRRIEELGLEEDDDDDETTVPSGPITGIGWLAPGATLIIVFVAAAAALVMFLETLRWNRGDVFSAQQREAAAKTRAD